jgi:hypothetical protein
LVRIAWRALDFACANPGGADIEKVCGLMIKKKARRAAQSFVRANADTPDYILDFEECSDRLDVCLRTFRRAIDRGEGPPVVWITERRRGVLASDFMGWIKSRRVGPDIGQIAIARPRGRPRKQPPIVAAE